MWILGWWWTFSQGDVCSFLLQLSHYSFPTEGCFHHPSLWLLEVTVALLSQILNPSIIVAAGIGNYFQNHHAQWFTFIPRYLPMAEILRSCWEISLCCCYSSIIVPPPYCHSNWVREKQFQSFLKAYLNYHTTGPPLPPPNNCAKQKNPWQSAWIHMRLKTEEKLYIHIQAFQLLRDWNAFLFSLIAVEFRACNFHTASWYNVYMSNTYV